MGTRQVYEERLRQGHLHHDPTMKPGLGTARCPRCLSLVDSSTGTSDWAINKVLHDFTGIVGSGVGGLASAIYSINNGLPYLQKRVKGPKWLPFVVGVPPFLMFSAAGAAFGGYALPNFAQLTVTSYYAASSSSHYGISLLTRHIEDAHASHIQGGKLT